MKKAIIFLLTLMLGVATITPVTHAQDGGTVTTGAELNVRTGPGTDYTAIGRVPQGATIIPEGRNAAGDWVLMHTPDNSLHGWVAAGYLIGLNLSALPLASGEVAAPAAAPASVPVGANQASTSVALNVRSGPGMDYEKVTTLSYGTIVTIEDVSGGWSKIRTSAGVTGWVATQYLSVGGSSGAGNVVPAGTAGVTSLSGSTLTNARNIFARGQRLGNRTNAFIKVGDSNMDQWMYFCNFQYGTYDLADYEELQGIVNLFNQTGSFCGVHPAARGGFATFNLLDELSADPGLCVAGETPLDCSVRITRPSVAFIYLGLIDMATLTRAEFSRNLDAIVDDLSAKGVIPVLFTFPIAERLKHIYNPEFNTVIREVAIANRVPLIDLQQLTLNMPDQGTGQDGYHLSYFEREDYMSFDAPLVATFGRNLRELLSLQMLAQIVQLVMGG